MFPAPVGSPGVIDTIQANAFSGAQPGHFFLPIVRFLENPPEKLVHQQQHLELLFCGRPGWQPSWTAPGNRAVNSVGGCAWTCSAFQASAG